MADYPFDASVNNRFFFAATGMDPDAVTKIVRNGLAKADGGELYLQRTQGKSISWSDGKLQSNSSSMDQGFGFRYIAGDAVAYAHSNNLSEKSIANAARTTRDIRNHADMMGKIALPSHGANRIYTGESPLADMTEAAQIQLLGEIDAYVRAADTRIVDVSAAISTSWDIVTIIRQDGTRLDDLRPMSSLNISVVAEENGRRETGRGSLSSRTILTRMFNAKSWHDVADKAIKQAQTNLRAIAAPSGDMPVIVANGWGGVLLHEAVGHGLEGDAARKGSTVFKTSMIGQKVAADCVTIVDQGDFTEARGSLSFDDEGVPTQRNVLIENGILRGYMQDTLNARLMGVAPTGNGRRESYEHAPIPRMTTTYMEGGKYTLDEMIESVDRGIYAVDFSGGQVDTVSGSYVFASTEAYLIENGKIVAPVKGVILEGNGPKSMGLVEMVGNDMEIAQSGSCGKDGQSVPVGIGQPSVKLRGIRVGGTEPS
ncbi:TldD/PmbA family protein [Micavibrio aeruginosavorus]|uniref:Modulator of DNA gyrase family protein n=1 Tax=Micavibrio aeruginosavorus (strain ARL-13) TaxID=856793 RepID=G2KQ53_MICAA|nr:metallopeptidase TldD-related protein [Micavibrio aeruginosavorus]AEP08595.1 modulator of DNA gyrase family protein [Micavibrio aeruginosavorus ARL-13]